MIKVKKKFIKKHSRANSIIPLLEMSQNDTIKKT